MNKKREKKGISAVITTILIIGLIVVISGIIFVFSKNVINKAGEEASGEKLCADAKFVVGDFCYKELPREIGKNEDGTPIYEQKMVIIFNGRNEVEEPELYGFLVYINYKGETISVPSLANNELEGLNAKPITTDFIEKEDGIKSIKVVPKIRNGNDIINCEKRDTTILWEEINECSI